MSVTLGTYTALPNPVSARRSVVIAGQTRTMADGSLAVHRKGPRYIWEYVWEGTTASMANVISACEAAIMTSKTFKAYEASATYTVIVDPDSYSAEPIEDSAGNAWRVTATIVEITV